MAINPAAPIETTFSELLRKEQANTRLSPAAKILLSKARRAAKGVLERGNMKAAVDILKGIDAVVSGGETGDLEVLVKKASPKSSVIGSERPEPVKNVRNKENYSGGSDDHEKKTLTDKLNQQKTLLLGINKAQVLSKLEDQASKDAFNAEYEKYKKLIEDGLASDDLKAMDQIARDVLAGVSYGMIKKANSVISGKYKAWKEGPVEAAPSIAASRQSKKRNVDLSKDEIQKVNRLMTKDGMSLDDAVAAVKSGGEAKAPAAKSAGGSDASKNKSGKYSLEINNDTIMQLLDQSTPASDVAEWLSKHSAEYDWLLTNNPGAAKKLSAKAYGEDDGLEDEEDAGGSDQLDIMRKKERDMEDEFGDEYVQRRYTESVRGKLLEAFTEAVAPEDEPLDFGAPPEEDQVIAAQEPEEVGVSDEPEETDVDPLKDYRHFGDPLKMRQNILADLHDALANDDEKTIDKILSPFPSEVQYVLRKYAPHVRREGNSFIAYWDSAADPKDKQAATKARNFMMNGQIDAVTSKASATSKKIIKDIANELLRKIPASTDHPGRQIDRMMANGAAKESLQYWITHHGYDLFEPTIGAYLLKEVEPMMRALRSQEKAELRGKLEELFIA